MQPPTKVDSHPQKNKNKITQHPLFFQKEFKTIPLNPQFYKFHFPKFSILKYEDCDYDIWELSGSMIG